MVALLAVIGLVVGVLLVWASDFLPTFSQNHKPENKQVSANSRWLSPLNVGVELLSIVSFAFLYGRYSLSLTMIFYDIVFSFLLLIAVIDVKYRLVLNILVYPAIVIVFMAQLVMAQHSMLSTLLGGGLAFGIFFLTARLKPGDLGSGDIKLAALIGLVFGFPGVLWALIVGAGTGALVAVVIVLMRHSTTKLYFPYAPFLCLGAMVALLYSPFFITG